MATFIPVRLKIHKHLKLVNFDVFLILNYVLYNCLRSEGPAQVFLILLVWMISAMQEMSRKDRQEIYLAYDNMCHLDNLKVAKKPLPLPGDLQFIWLDIKKIIDSLHLKNHKDAMCHEVPLIFIICNRHTLFLFIAVV